jgi:hypothetical protein
MKQQFANYMVYKDFKNAAELIFKAILEIPC